MSYRDDYEDKITEYHTYDRRGLLTEVKHIVLGSQLHEREAEKMLKAKRKAALHAQLQMIKDLYPKEYLYK